MKRIWWNLFILCNLCVFAACSDDKETTEELEICPFRNATLQQTTAKAGEVVTISGEGFASNLNLYLRSEYIKIQVDAPEIAAGGDKISFAVPDVDKGVYKVIVEQEGEWPLNEKLTIEKEDIIVTAKRKLLSFSYDNGLEGKKNISFEFRYTWQGDSLLTVRKVNPENKDQLLDYLFFDYPASDTIRVRANMAVVDNSSNQTGVKDFFTMVLDENRVKYCINSGVSSDWIYSGKSYLQVAYSSPKSQNGYEYNLSGNLTRWDMGNQMIVPTNFVYDRNEEVNLMGIDFGALYGLTVTSSLNAPELYAHIMRLAGRASTLLPSGVKGRDKGENNTTVSVVFDFNYIKDAEGFVTEASSTQYTKYIESNGNLVEVYATQKFFFTWE